MATLEELVVKIKVEGAEPAKKAYKDVGDAATQAGKAVKEFDAEFKGDDGKWHKYGSNAKGAFKDVGDAADEAGEKVQKFGDETDNVGKKSSGSLTKLIPSWQAIGAAVAAATAVLVGAGGKMIQMAADADATTAKFATIFSGMEDATQAWVDQFVADTGRHKYATMDALSDIQAVSTAMGVEKEAGVEMAKALLERSTDVAAFFNANDPEVLEAIKSGLTGEMEPLKKYGVILSEANVQQELSNMLGAEGAKTATAAQKVQARTNIILAQTSAIQGQQAREAGSLQEQWKRLSNTLSTTFASAGRDAMQSMTGIITRINQLLGAGGIAAIEGVLKRVADGVAWVVDGVLDVVEAFDRWGKSGLYDTLRDFADRVMRNLVDVVNEVRGAVQEFAGRGGLERLSVAAGIVVNNITAMYRTLDDLGVFDAMSKVIGVIVNGLLGFVDVVAYTIIEFDKFKRAVLTTIADVLDAIGMVVPGADEMAAGIRHSLERVPTEAAAALAPFPGVVSSSIQNAGAPASTSARNVGTGATNALSAALVPMQPNTSAAMRGVAGAISGSGGALYSAAASAGQQAVNGFGSKVTELRNLSNQIAGIFRTTTSQAASIKSSYDSASYYASSMPSSGHGGSSSSTGSTGIKRQGSDGTGEGNVKIREIHDTGGMASYTGWHWMKKGEVAIPPQYDWQTAVVNPVVNALGGKTGQGSGIVTVNINNKAADVNTTAKTIAKVTKASVRAVMV